MKKIENYNDVKAQSGDFERHINRIRRNRRKLVL